MGNSIYLGGGIKSAFCGGNVKEIYQGTNKLFPSGGGGDPMPEGYEQVDYVEVITGGYLHNSKGQGSLYVFNDILDTDIFDIEGLYSSTDYGMWGDRSLIWLSGAIVFRLYSGYGYGIKYNLNESNYTTYWTNNEEPFNFKIHRTKQNLSIDINDKNYSLGANYLGNSGFRSIWQTNSLNVGTRLNFIKISKEDGSLRYKITAARRKSDGAPAFVEIVTGRIFDLDSSAYKTSKDA